MRDGAGKAFSHAANEAGRMGTCSEESVYSSVEPYVSDSVHRSD